jgi:hypothetical protein
MAENARQMEDIRDEDRNQVGRERGENTSKME